MKSRSMEASDVDRVADLLTQLGYPATAQQIAPRFERREGEPGERRAVAWIHVGANPYLECDASAEILGLVVSDSYRSRGIGKALVDAAESWASSQGCSLFRVRSRITRDRAHAFSERGGFKRIKTQHCFEKRLG